VKPDYFVIWDVFETAHGPSRFYLHPREPMVALGEGRFRAGRVGSRIFCVQFVLPSDPQVVVNAQLGPLWEFAVQKRSWRSLSGVAGTAA